MSEISKDIIELNYGEMFASADRKVICWEGENYYRACGAFVADLEDGGQTSCVKRIGHPSHQHEDFDGRLKLRQHGDEAAVIGKDAERDV